MLVRAGLLVGKQWLDHGPNRCKLLLKSLKIAPVGLRRRCVKKVYFMPWRVKPGASVARFDEHERYQMGHAKSLRVIGQSLAVAKLQVLELQTDGPNYILSSDALTKIGEWILCHALSHDDISDQRAPQSAVSRAVSFGQSDISRLDDQAQKLRRNDSSPHTEAYSRAL